MCDPVTAAVIIGSGATMMQAKAAEKQAGRMADLKYSAEQQQLQDNRVAVKLDAAQKANTLKEIFLRDLSNNNMILSANKPMLLQAIADSRQGIFKQDLNSVALSQRSSMSELAGKSYDSRLQLAATKATAKQATRAAYIKGATTIATASAGLMKKPTTGNIGNTSMVDFKGTDYLRATKGPTGGFAYSSNQFDSMGRLIK